MEKKNIQKQIDFPSHSVNIFPLFHPALFPILIVYTQIVVPEGPESIHIT